MVDHSLPLLRSMACMTISAADPHALGDLLVTGMGWEQCAAGPITSAMTSAWGVTDLEGMSYALYRSPGASRGMIRVVPGADRFPSRPIGARWSGVEIVVMKDIDGLFEQLVARSDFQVEVAPDNADFSAAGANIHRFFQGRGPGGTHMMFTAEVTEARDYQFPRADAAVGYIFSIPLVTTRYAELFAVLRDTLGMTPILEDHLIEGIWHKTWGLDAGTPVDLSILKGDAPGFGEGGIELQGYPEDVVDRALFLSDRFDGGACLGTFVATDFDRAYARLSTTPLITATTTPIAIDTPPYHGGRSFTIVLPGGGARLEIAERFATWSDRALPA